MMTLLCVLVACLLAAEIVELWWAFKKRAPGAGQNLDEHIVFKFSNFVHEVHARFDALDKALDTEIYHRRENDGILDQCQDALKKEHAQRLSGLENEIKATKKCLDQIERTTPSAPAFK